VLSAVEPRVVAPVTTGRCGRKPFDAGTLDGGPLDAEPLHAEPLNAQPLDAQPDVWDQLALLKRVTVSGGLRGATAEDALQVIEAAEVVKAWAESRAVAAAACLTRELESDRSRDEAGDLTRMGRQRFVRECRSVAAREIQVATGRPITQCQSLIWLAACEDERTATVRSLMALGRLSYHRALCLVERTQGLDAVAADRIAATVLAPLRSPSGEVLPEQAPLSQATFNRRLHRQLVLHHGLIGEAERTHAEAVRRRDCRSESHAIGTGQLLVLGDGPRIAAAGERVDRLARRLRKDGDARTISQLRSDVALDLLMRGWIPDDPMFQSLGEAPQALVRVVVPLATLFEREAARRMLGSNPGSPFDSRLSPTIGAGCGEILGFGDISAAQCRALAMRMGSTWERIVTDPLTGRAIEKSAGSYSPPKDMHDQVCVRDGTCRAPGCEVPAYSSDLDHDQDWAPHDAGGLTAETNLAAKHRGHHNLKTRRWWSTRQHPDGVIHWTTATGRRYTTHPYVYDDRVYDDPSAQHADQSSLELRLGSRLAPALNPAPLTARGRDFLVGLAWAEALADTTPPTRVAAASVPEGSSAGSRKPLDPGPPPF